MQRLVFPLVARLAGRTFNNLSRTSPRPDAPLYALRGKYTVGTRDFQIPDRKRPLRCAMWYPAQNPERKEQLATYFEGAAHFIGHALRNAHPASEAAPFPLVIFSHGSGGVRFQSLYLTEHLASHGFVVMGVDHTGNTIFDGILSPEKYEVNRIRNYIQRPSDILRQIAFAEELTAADGDMPGLIDMNRIAVTGHSFGGYSALAAAGACLNFDALNAWCADPANVELDSGALGSVCYLRHHVELFAEQRGLTRIPSGLWEPTTDPRIRAVVAMAPWNAPIFGKEGLQQLKIPALVMVGSADPVTIPERDAYPVYEYLGSSSKYLMVLENAGHFIFVDECSELLRRFDMFDICSDKVWDMARAHDLINHMITAFLLAKIDNDPVAEEALAPDAVNYRAVRYRVSECEPDSNG